MTPTTQEALNYADICKRECLLCKAGNDAECGQHFIEYEDRIGNQKYVPCTAPTRDQVIERLSAELAAERERLRVARRPGDAAIEAKADEMRSLFADWDNEGAPAICEAAIQAALAVLNSKGQLTPCSSGGVQIDWDNCGDLLSSRRFTGFRRISRELRSGNRSSAESGGCDSSV